MSFDMDEYMGNACEIEGCSFAVYGKGMCRAHYMRKRRHGDPLAGRASGAKRGDPEAWLIAHKDHAEDECLIWPFFRVNDRGYGRIGRRLAHREMCRLAHGEPPFDGALATHECGNGHGGCVNPGHLVWATSQKNASDKGIHGSVLAGERNIHCKLNWEQVSKIRKLAGTRKNPGPMTQQAVADEMGISQGQVSRIVLGKSW